MTTARIITYLVACVLGYVGRILVEWSQRRHRERVLRALGGKLPDWEERARELEGRAHENLVARTPEGKDMNNAQRIARIYRGEADVTRKRGRRRDREWT
jgi:hypothetical protein